MDQVTKTEYESFLQRLDDTTSVLSQAALVTTVESLVDRRLVARAIYYPTATRYYIKATQ